MKSSLVAAVVLALLAGPPLGTCGGCCPASPVPVSVSAAASCCGDCETTVGRSPNAPSLAASSSVTVPADATLLSVVAPTTAPPPPAAVSIAPPSSASPPHRPPLALRL